MERGGIHESKKYRVRNRCGCRRGKGSFHDDSGWGNTKTVGCGSTEQAEGLGPDSLTYH